jgi:hypothetical protein
MFDFVLPQIWRPTGELPSEVGQPQFVPHFELPLSEPMLLKMMLAAQAYRPFVGWLLAQTAIRATSNMSTFDR